MGPLTRNGSRLTGLNLLLLPLLSVSYAQTGPLTCVASAVPTSVRLEGIAEPLGDILLDCTGGVPGTSTEGNLIVSLPVPVANRLSGDSTLDAMLLINTGSGFQPAVSGSLLSAQQVAFSGVRFTIPANGRVALRISNLRANISRIPNAQQPVAALLAFNGLNVIALQNNPVAVAVTERGLLASFATRGIPCVGSRLPETIDLPSLLAAGTFYTPTRVTEGFPSAFQPRDISSTNGTRILSRYSGFPPGARLFVPDLITSGNLVLGRVLHTDPNGAGGVPVTPGAGGVTVNSVSEVPLVNGTGIAVYEVLAANPLARESFEFPTFLGYTPPNNNSNTVIASQQLSFAPLSTVATADSAAPVPRFTGVIPPSDCSALNDCDAEYFPKLNVSSPPLQFTGFAGGTAWAPKYFTIRNDHLRRSDMFWTVSVNYRNGSGWLLVDPRSGVNNGTVRLDVLMVNLTPGTYEATLTVDAGSAGTQTLPVVALVNALPPVPEPKPQPPAEPGVTVTSVGNAASPWPGPLTPGSLGTLQGSKLSGSRVSVTFDGVPATVLYSSQTQINLLVPGELGTKTAAQMVVNVDGATSTPQTVTLAPVAPAIFPTGVLNQNNTANTTTTGAPVGSVVQLFVTGLIPPSGGNTVTVKLHDREDLMPLYFGVAPGLQGVQQVNVRVPEDLPAMTTEVLVCGTDPSGQKVCSLPVKITLTE